MAKYRITSIPQSLPKAQDGLEKKKGQTKSKLRNFFYGDGTQPKLAMDLFNTDFFNEDPALVEKPQVVSQPSNYPMIPVDGQEQFDMFNLRTEQERANTLPTIWNRTADQQVQCPEGKYPYKGECFSEEMYVKLMQEEMDDEQYRFDVETAEKNREFENKINQIRQERIDQQNLWEKEATDNYILNFKKSKKSDKIEPLHSISSYKLNLDGNVPMVDAEGNPIIDEKTGEPKYQTQRDVLQQAYLVIEDKENGVTKLYPKEIVYDRIIRNGFQANQFKNIWGIDPKQVKNQVGDVMNAAAQQYDATMKQKILQRAMDEGKTIQQVISELSPKLATKEGAKSFIAPTQKIIDDALAEIKRNIEEAPDATYDNNLSQDEKIFFSNNPVDEWERTYHPNMFSKYYIDKYERGQKAYDDWMKRYDVDIYEGNTFAKDDRMANQRAKTQFDNRIITRNNAESAKKSAENKEFDKAFGKYAQHISSDFSKDLLVEAINNLDQKGKLKFLTDIQKNPKDQSIAIQKLLNTKEDGKTYADRLESGLDAILERRANPDTIKQGSSYNINEDNFTKVKDVLRNPGDAFYYWMNPRENMWDVATNLSYSERKKLEDENPGLDLGTMPTNVMSPFNFLLQPLNPFKIGFNLREGYDEGNFMGALGSELWDVGSTYGGIKGLNAIGKGTGLLRPILGGMDNAFTTAGGLINSKEYFNKAQQSFDAGNYLDALQDFGAGALYAYPAYNALNKLGKYRSFGPTFQNFNFNTNPNSRFQLGTNKGLLNSSGTSFQKGGSIPKAQLGTIVKGLKTLGTYADNQITHFQDGGQLYQLSGSPAVYRKLGNKWEVDWNRSGNFQPISKGDVKEREANLNKNAKPIYGTENPFTNNWVNNFTTTDAALTRASNAAPTVENAKKLNRLVNQRAIQDAKAEAESQALQQKQITDVPLAQVSDNTQTYSDDVERAAIASKPLVDAAKKRQAEFQKEFQKKLWEQYNKMSASERAIDRVKGFMSDPFGMTSRAVMGEQGYLPGMGEGLLPNNPYYKDYISALGYTPGEMDMFNVQSMINPMYWGASIGNNMRQGNYLDAGIEAALTFAPMAPKGTGSNIFRGAQMIQDDVARLKNAYNNVATGNTSIPFAWKSPASGLKEGQLFETALNSGKLTPKERALLVEYQHNSKPFTGRTPFFDPDKQKQINEIIKKYNLADIDPNAVATRRFETLGKDNLGATLEGKTLSFGDRPTSFSVGPGELQNPNLVRNNRIVIPPKHLQKLKKNFMASEYSNLSDDVLKNLDPSIAESEFVKKNLIENNPLDPRSLSKIESEIIGTGLDFKVVGKVKNELGGLDYVVHPNTANKTLPGSPNVISSVDDVSRVVADTPQPWQMQELPGLHLKSTMEGEAISKIVEPKTGLINVDQALAIIGKESGGADKVALIKKGLGNNIPKKMDYNEFRKTVQDQLIPLERQFVDHSSNYGINRLGYKEPEFITRTVDGKIINEMTSDVIENQTLILGNKSKFGRGSSAHGNPDETLGHIHFLRDAETPDVLTVTQIQSDAFQGTHRIMPKDSKNLTALEKQQKSLARMEELQERNKAVLNKMKTEGVDEAGLPVQDYQVKQFEDIVKAQENSNIFKKADIENFTQKSLLDKNHQERFLQEFVAYAAERGDINKIRVPTSETAAKVQGYNPTSYDAGPTFFQGNKNDVIPKYFPKDQTILKKYSELPKTIKKLFDQEAKIVTDSRGNTWYEFDIPENFKGKKGEIKAFKLGGAAASLPEQRKGGYVGNSQLKSKIAGVAAQLTQDEINQYIAQGYIVEEE
jgi:hypothetical protein